MSKRRNKEDAIERYSQNREPLARSLHRWLLWRDVVGSQQLHEAVQAVSDYATRIAGRPPRPGIPLRIQLSMTDQFMLLTVRANASTMDQAVSLDAIDGYLEFNPEARACRRCGCTEYMACVVDGVPCHWVDSDLCSACDKRKGKE